MLYRNRQHGLPVQRPCQDDVREQAGDPFRPVVSLENGPQVSNAALKGPLGPAPILTFFQPATQLPRQVRTNQICDLAAPAWRKPHRVAPERQQISVRPSRLARWCQMKGIPDIGLPRQPPLKFRSGGRRAQRQTSILIGSPCLASLIS